MRAEKSPWAIPGASGFSPQCGATNGIHSGHTSVETEANPVSPAAHATFRFFVRSVGCFGSFFSCLQ